MGLLRALAWVFVTGCLGTTPYEEIEASLGPEAPGVEEGPFHRPGQPCLACHSEEHSPGDDVFMLAGTIYERPDSEAGLAGAEVLIADSGGHGLVARTNRVGNFFVKREGDEEAGLPMSDSDGKLEVPYRLVFPIYVMVRSGVETAIMESAIEREGSCGACHEPEPGARSNGRVYVTELP